MKPTPVIRKEMYLNAMGADGTIPVPSPYPRIEKYLYRLDGFDDKDIPSPENRIERYLYWLCGYRDKWIDTPVTRIDKYMYYACGGEGYGYPTPVTREERFWYDYIQAYIEVKTLTGTLPLTFTTSETALRSWTIYGNNTPHNYSAEGTLPLTFTTHTAGNADDWSISGNNNIGKNLLEITAENQTLRGVTFTVDKAAGTITLNGDTTQQTAGFSFEVMSSYDLDGTFILSGGADGGSASKYDLYMYDAYDQRYSDRLYDSSSECSFTCVSGHKTSVFVQARKNNIYSNIVFRPMLRLAGTSPEFVPYQIGVGQRTKNLFDKTATDINKGYAESYYIASNGLLTASNNWNVSEYMDTEANTVYTLCRATTSGNSVCYAEYDSSSQFIRAVAYAGVQNVTFTTSLTTAKIRISIYKNSVSATMLVKGSTAPSSFIPYGYEISLNVNNTPQDIYIGDSPLTAGETISKASTGVDIAAIAGTNTITTELYNKPEMAIEGVDYVGVGEYVNGQWQIPLSVTCDRNLFNIHGNMARSGGIQPIDFNVETSSVTGEMSADSHYILGYANAIVKGDETFVISFDKTTAGTAEMRMMNGTGSSAEIIETFDISAAKSYRVVFECKESFGNVYPWLVATEAATNTFEHIMIKKASDKGGFVPYGAHTDYTIPIDAPLTEGQSVTDTLTINTFEGENTIDTTMANKPNMSITYKGG